MGKLNCIIIDCADPKTAANFWAQALEGYKIDEQPWGITLKSATDHRSTSRSCRKARRSRIAFT